MLSTVGVSAVASYVSTDPADKAVALSEGISETMNVGVVALVAMLLGPTVWSIARSRVNEMTIGRR